MGKERRGKWDEKKQCRGANSMAWGGHVWHENMNRSKKDAVVMVENCDDKTDEASQYVSVVWCANKAKKLTISTMNFFLLLVWLTSSQQLFARRQGHRHQQPNVGESVSSENFHNWVCHWSSALIEIFVDFQSMIELIFIALSSIVRSLAMEYYRVVFLLKHISTTVKNWF